VERAVNEFSEENELGLSEPIPVSNAEEFLVRSTPTKLPSFVPSKSHRGYRAGYVYGNFLREDGTEMFGYNIAPRPSHFSEAQRSAPPGRIDVVMGDMLRLNKYASGGLFDACYDRAALVAMRPDQRELYVNAVCRMLKSGGICLLVVLEHDGFRGGKLGPPYAVEAEDVKRLYGDRFDVELLERADEIERAPKNSGVGKWVEVTYLLTKRGLRRRDSYDANRHRLLPIQT